MGVVLHQLCRCRVGGGADHHEDGEFVDDGGDAFGRGAPCGAERAALQHRRLHHSALSDDRKAIRASAERMSKSKVGMLSWPTRMPSMKR
jgi:hypothetical protein